MKCGKGNRASMVKEMNSWQCAKKKHESGAPPKKQGSKAKPTNNRNDHMANLIMKMMI